MTPEPNRYWFERLTWSWSFSFALLAGLALLISLPTSAPLRAALMAPGRAPLFPVVVVVLLGLHAVNLGQLQGHPMRWGYARYGPRLGPHLRQLSARLSLLVLLIVPHGVVFYAVFSLRGPSGLALVYLWLYAQLWGGFGLWLSLKGFAEINQFKLKYLALALYLLPTLFMAQPLNPFLTLQVLLNPNAWQAAEWGFVGLAFAGLGALLALVAAALAALSRRLLAR